MIALLELAREILVTEIARRVSFGLPDRPELIVRRDAVERRLLSLDAERIP